MGERNGPYKADFPEGTLVEIANRGLLEDFKKEWKYHHPLQPQQLAFAGKTAEVVSIGFYHGGDVLYWLKDIPGVWHEQCLKERGEESSL